MTLYLYRVGEEQAALTIENVQSYTADSVTALDEHGGVAIYSPLAEDCELSSKEDCSEALRADWRKANPGTENQVNDLVAENNLLRQQVSALTEQQSFYEDCIAEMAEVVYA